ncbi:MAG: TolC family protein [Thermodesulfobacteriota bacterium]
MTVASAENENGTLEMNLMEAIRIGLRHSRQVKMTYMDRVLEKFDLAERRAEFQPNITVDGDLNISSSRTDTDYNEQASSHEQKVSRSAAVNPKAVQKLPTGGELMLQYAWGHDARWREDGSGHEDNWSEKGEWRATFTQPLLKGAGTDYNTASLKRTEMDSREAILGLRDDLSSQVLNIINAYNSLWSAQENLRIEKNSLEDAREQMRVNKLQIETGRKPESDILQVESNVARQELSYENALNSLDQARMNLLDVLDLDLEREVEAVEEYSFAPKSPDLERCLRIARENNTAIIRARNNLRRSELTLMQAKRDKLWDLSFDADYTKTNQNDIDAANRYNEDYWQVGLSLKIPLHFWGQSKYGYERGVLSARINLDKSRMQLKEAMDDLRTEIVNKVRNVRHAEKQVELARKSREISYKSYKMDDLKLRLGRITNNDFVDSQERLSSAQKSEVEAIISYIDRLNSLDNYLGTLLETYDLEFKKSRPAVEKKYLEDKTWMLD